MSVRLLVTGSAVLPGAAQSMRPGAAPPGMERGRIGDDGGQSERAMKRLPGEMRKSVKAKETMRTDPRKNVVADPDVDGAADDRM